VKHRPRESEGPGHGACQDFRVEDHSQAEGRGEGRGRGQAEATKAEAKAEAAKAKAEAAKEEHNKRGAPCHEVRGDMAVLAPRAAVTAQEQALPAAHAQRVCAAGRRWVLLVARGGAGDAARAARCGAREGGHGGGAACLQVAFLWFVLPAALMPGSVLILSSPAVFSLRGAAALASSGGVLRPLAVSERL